MTATLQVPHASIATLRERVRKPAFLEKLARDWNVVPRTKADEDQLFEIAGYLRAAHNQEQVKTASTNNPFLTNVLNGLKNALRDEGFQTGPTTSEQLQKQAAAQQVQTDQVVADAAAEYGNYLLSLEQVATR